MEKLTTHTIRNDDGSVSVTIETEGDDAYRRVAEALDNQTSGIDRDRVGRVHVEMDIANDERPDDEPTDEPAEKRSPDTSHRKSGKQKWTHYSEDDREYGDVKPGTAAHEALSALVDHDVTDEGSAVDQRAVIEWITDQAPGTVSSSLGSELYLRRALDRKNDPGKREGVRYLYWVSDHGLKIHNNLGHYDESGGM